MDEAALSTLTRSSAGSVGPCREEDTGIAIAQPPDNSVRLLKRHRCRRDRGFR